MRIPFLHHVVFKRSMTATLLIASSIAGIGGFSAAYSAYAQHEALQQYSLSTDIINEQLFTMNDLSWHDATRQRDIPVRLYLPTIANPQHPVPLVIFSHGIGGSRQGYSYLGQFWASQGFASLHVQHIGSDRNLWFGNPFKLVDRLHRAAQDSEALNRVKDIQFTLDKISPTAPSQDAKLSSESHAEPLASEPLFNAINRDQIVMAGHSYGASTAMLMLGAQVTRNGEVLNFGDKRLKAGILMSAPPFYGAKEHTAAILSHITVPTLHLTATEDFINIPNYESGAEDRLTIFKAMRQSPKLFAMFEGGSHSIFTDRKATGGYQRNAEVKLATQQLSLRFLRHIFTQDLQSLTAQQDFGAWSTQHQHIIAQWLTDTPLTSTSTPLSIPIR
jgi:predicted dienelactone hydrolase